LNAVSIVTAVIRRALAPSAVAVSFCAPCRRFPGGRRSGARQRCQCFSKPARLALREGGTAHRSLGAERSLGRGGTRTRFVTRGSTPRRSVARNPGRAGRCRGSCPTVPQFPRRIRCSDPACLDRSMSRFLRLTPNARRAALPLLSRIWIAAAVDSLRCCRRTQHGGFFGKRPSPGINQIERPSSLLVPASAQVVWHRFDCSPGRDLAAAFCGLRHGRPSLERKGLQPGRGGGAGGACLLRAARGRPPCGFKPWRPEAGASGRRYSSGFRGGRGRGCLGRALPSSSLPDAAVSVAAGAVSAAGWFALHIRRRRPAWRPLRPTSSAILRASSSLSPGRAQQEPRTAWPRFQWNPPAAAPRLRRSERRGLLIGRRCGGGRAGVASEVVLEDLVGGGAHGGLCSAVLCGSSRFSPK